MNLWILSRTMRKRGHVGHLNASTMFDHHNPSECPPLDACIIPHCRPGGAGHQENSELHHMACIWAQDVQEDTRTCLHLNTREVLKATSVGIVQQGDAFK
jgi:hypothetical protein